MATERSLGGVSALHWIYKKQVKLRENQKVYFCILWPAVHNFDWYFELKMTIEYVMSKKLVVFVMQIQYY